MVFAVQKSLNAWGYTLNKDFQLIISSYLNAHLWLALHKTGTRVLVYVCGDQRTMYRSECSLAICVLGTRLRFTGSVGSTFIL